MVSGFFKESKKWAVALAAIGLAVYVVSLLFNNLPNAPTITVGNSTVTVPQATSDIGFLPARVILENITTVTGILLVGFIIYILSKVEGVKEFVKGLFSRGGY